MPIFAFHHIVIFSKGNLEFYCYKRETKLIYEKITLSANFEISKFRNQYKLFDKKN